VFAAFGRQTTAVIFGLLDLAQIWQPFFVAPKANLKQWRKKNEKQNNKNINIAMPHSFYGLHNSGQKYRRAHVKI